MNDYKKEIILIYSASNLLEKDRLAVLFLYHIFLINLEYLINDEDVSENYKELLKDELVKYCNKYSLSDDKVNYNEFMNGYLNDLENRKEVKDIVEFNQFVEDYKIRQEEILSSNNWINIVNSKNISFSDKSNIVLNITSLLFSNCNLYEELNGTEVASALEEDLVITISAFLSEIDYDTLSMDVFLRKLNDLVRDFNKGMLELGRINFDDTKDDTINYLMANFNEREKIIFKTFLLYHISGIDIKEIFSRLEMEIDIANILGVSSFKSGMILNKFNKKYAKLYNNLMESKVDTNSKKLRKKEH